jgi:formimidoylglutamate deiminase
LLPTFYAHGGFGAKPLAEKQLRFSNDVATLSAICRERRRHREPADRAPIGASASHSLRACDRAGHQIRCWRRHPGERPIHIHIAEQTKESRGLPRLVQPRPVEWLYDKVEIDRRWCLIHATHVTPDEVHMMATAKPWSACVPTTEANLGDGIFPAQEFLARNGAFRHRLGLACLGQRARGTALAGIRPAPEA